MVKAVDFETISDSNDMDGIEFSEYLNEDIVVRQYRGGLVDIYNYTEDSGVVLRPEEAEALRRFLERYKQ